MFCEFLVEKLAQSGTNMGSWLGFHLPNMNFNLFYSKGLKMPLLCYINSWRAGAKGFERLESLALAILPVGQTSQLLPTSKIFIKRQARRIKYWSIKSRYYCIIRWREASWKLNEMLSSAACSSFTSDFLIQLVWVPVVKFRLFIISTLKIRHGILCSWIFRGDLLDNFLWLYFH